MSGDVNRSTFRETGGERQDFPGWRGDRFFNADVMTHSEFEAAGKEIARGKGKQADWRIEFNRELTKIKDIGGFADEDVLAEWLRRNDEDIEGAADAAGETAAEEEAAKLEGRRSRRKSRNVGAQSILAPIPSGRPRLKNILGVG